MLEISRSFPAMTVFVLAGALSVAAHAAPADYAFEPVDAQVKYGSATELAVRLVHKQTGKPVPGAVLFRTRLDMSPDNMADMVAPLEVVASDQPGVYRFKASLDMAGGWALKIMAKVPGETDTVQATVIFHAKD